MEFVDRLKGLAVELIRLLWKNDIYPELPWFREVHDNWFEYWVAFKTEQTMREVDEQIEEALSKGIDPPLYWDQEEGETPLGGPLDYRYQFDDAPSSADPLQGSEQRKTDGE